MKEKLQTLGLTSGEAAVYLALLKEGQSTVGPIVKKAKVAYSNIYEILNRLIEKGLVSFVVKEKTRHYKAAPASNIRVFLEKEEEELKEKKRQFESIMPHLEKLADAHKSQGAEMFLGVKGVVSAYEELMRNAVGCEGRYFYVHKEAYYDQAARTYKKIWKITQKYKTKWRGVSNTELQNTQLAAEYPKLIEQRYIDFPLPGNIDILKDKVLLTLWQEQPIAILIQSQEVATNFMEYFEEIWRIAKK